MLKTGNLWSLALSGRTKYYIFVSEYRLKFAGIVGVVDGDVVILGGRGVGGGEGGGAGKAADRSLQKLWMHEMFTGNVKGKTSMASLGISMLAQEVGFWDIHISTESNVWDIHIATGSIGQRGWRHVTVTSYPVHGKWKGKMVAGILRTGCGFQKGKYM